MKNIVFIYLTERPKQPTILEFTSDISGEALWPKNKEKKAKGEYEWKQPWLCIQQEQKAAEY